MLCQWYWGAYSKIWGPPRVNYPNPLRTTKWTRPISSSTTTNGTGQGGTSLLYPFSISSSAIYTQGYDPSTSYYCSSLNMLKVSLSPSQCSLTLLYAALSYALLSVLYALGYTECLHRLGADAPIDCTSTSLDVSWTVAHNPKKDERPFAPTQAIDKNGSTTVGELWPLNLGMGMEYDQGHFVWMIPL